MIVIVNPETHEPEAVLLNGRRYAPADLAVLLERAERAEAEVARLRIVADAAAHVSLYAGDEDAWDALASALADTGIASPWSGWTEAPTHAEP